MMSVYHTPGVYGIVLAIGCLVIIFRVCMRTLRWTFSTHHSCPRLNRTNQCVVGDFFLCWAGASMSGLVQVATSSWMWGTASLRWLMVWIAFRNLQLAQTIKNLPFLLQQMKKISLYVLVSAQNVSAVLWQSSETAGPLTAWLCALFLHLRM